MAKVYAFQPRKIDPPHFVAETYEELAPRVGEYIGGEQCDGCGNSVYRIESVFSAKCAVDPSDDPESQHPEPCGIGHPIGLWDEDEVTF